MHSRTGGLSVWVGVPLAVVVGPAVSFFVADSIVTAHDLDEELGVLAWLCIMALWIGALLALDDSIARRQEWYLEQKRRAEEHHDE